MSSRHLVDPELLPLLDQFATVVLDTATLADLRRAEAGARLPAPPNSVRLERHWATAADGHRLGLDVYLPAPTVPRPLGCIYHIHGGGYVGGAPELNEFFLRPMAEQLGCAIVSVAYRLAPEHPHPTPVEDCFAGLGWTVAAASALGIDRARIGVMGESAGGGLAAALALLTRDRGGPALAFQLLTYPMLDDRSCTRADHGFAGEFIWTAHNNRFGWRALLGEEPGAPGISPYAAPARAGDLAHLPPSWIATGALDLFAEENIDHARRLLAAGVPCELHLYPGAFHGFDILPVAEVSRRAAADRLAALERFLRPAGLR
ncbi:MAG: alpha/beta hydrolase [Sphingomonadales bacterium]|nr:alpha/beta hydrolase [Sphingomonadales bacterium]